MLPGWFWPWARWYLGRSEFKGHARDPKLRPASAPKVIPAWAWQELARRFAKQPPPPAPGAALTSLARNVMFTAWAPEAALGCPPGWKVALSADLAYDEAARAAAPKLKQAGLRVGAWGNQAQTGAGRLRSFADSIGATFVIFQAETAGEYASAVAAGANLIVGNIDAWTDAQRADATAKCHQGVLAVLMECYSNMTGVWPDTASSRGVPIACEVVGVGGWENRPDVQLDAYRSRTPAGVWQTMSIYLAEDMSPGSWAELRRT